MKDLNIPVSNEAQIIEIKTVHQEETNVKVDTKEATIPQEISKPTDKKQAINQNSTLLEICKSGNFKQEVIWEVISDIMKKEVTQQIPLSNPVEKEIKKEQLNLHL